jgi:hypothetical protein
MKEKKMATIIDTFKMLPPEAQREVSDFIEFIANKYLRKKNAEKCRKEEILKFSGSWKDMDEEDFQDFLNDVQERRESFFSRRREP